MYTLIAFATQWGSKHGGINSFNTDFLSAFGFAYHHSAQVICIVAGDTPEEREDARKAHVCLLPLPYPPKDKFFSSAQAQVGIDKLKRCNISFNPDKTVWLGHDLITGAAANEAAKIAGGRSALIHHMSYDHYESYAENSITAYKKKQEQTALFQQADLLLAVGPLLRDALNDRLGESKPVHMLIPGLAEIETRCAPKTFTAFLSGRLSDDAARIKQSHLGIAAFAQAHREARDNDMPEGLCRQPKLTLRGVDFEAQLAHSPSQPHQDLETELKEFAEKYAHGVINLHALPYTQDRQTLYSDLSAASVALMPSWHEGFGLVAWEAIAAGVPLIVSKNSGVYRLLEENHPGAESGYVYPIDVRGLVSSPFFHQEDLKSVVAALKAIANNPGEARRKAATLRNLLGDYTWATCAEQAAEVFEWPLQKGSMPTTIHGQMVQAPNYAAPTSMPPVSTPASPLLMPTKQWQAGVGMADSQLLRAEEALVQFDPARRPELDKLNTWLDDTRWPQAVRLITGAGGVGKTRLALELCRLRLELGWQAGLLDSDLGAKEMIAAWQTLRNINQPLFIVIDYAETRQTVLLALIKALLQNHGNYPVRLLLLARDGGEWWDNLPSKDSSCEPLLNGYATSGPFCLPPLYTAENDRRKAYKQALHTFAQTLGVIAPDIIPDLTGEHFERPLYLQMAALLALYGERPTTAEGLTKALLNRERRYWRGLLAHFKWAEPERHAQQLLALTTLADGFTTPKDAQHYWTRASGNTLSSADFNSLFHSLGQLYPGKLGLQALQPDLLGEALVAQTILLPEADTLLDTVLASSANQHIRRNALTVLARLSSQRVDLHEILVEALTRHFAHCSHDIVAVSTEATSQLPTLAEKAFVRLSLAAKSQAAGLLKPIIMDESVQLAELNCLIAEYLVAKLREKYLKKRANVDRAADYARALNSYSITLSRTGRGQQALSFALESMKLFNQLNGKDQKRFEPEYATSLGNHANRLSDAGQNQEALEHSRQALEIRQRLAKKNPDRYEQYYAMSLNNYASHLSDAGQSEKALEHSRQALEIRQRLAKKNPDRYEPDYAMSLNNYASHLSNAGQSEKAIEHSRQALEIYQRLAKENFDRYEPDYAMSLNNYANHLSDAGQSEKALEHSRQALEIYQRLAKKNSDRYEPDYAMSLNNYAAHLRDAGQSEEALEHSRQALEIRQRLAKKNPDRYEPDYAMSLNNYASHLGDAGQNEKALEHSRQALEIYQRLAQKNPVRFAEDLFNNTCLANFLSWLCNQIDMNSDPADLNSISTMIPPLRRSLMLLFVAFVQACWAKDQTTRIELFKQVLSYWDDLSPANKTQAQDQWLCAAAWCATFAPADVMGLDWQASWHQYANQRHGCLPHWMQELARRLSFQWPA